jgi:uncharacterized membrane-anchored protein YhcB (DUF1043 family)
MTKIFNTNGDISAESLKDALAQITKYASVIEHMQSSSTSLAGSSSFTDEQKDEMIAQAMLTSEGCSRSGNG